MVHQPLGAPNGRKYLEVRDSYNQAMAVVIDYNYKPLKSS